MTLLERIKDLCKKRSISVAQLETTLKLPSNTIYQWKNRIPGTEKLALVADFFDVTIDYLLGRTNTPKFTQRDEKDIQDLINEMISGLSDKNSLAYMKNGGEELDEEAAELLRDSLERTARRAKILAKEKFTPNQYRQNKQGE